MSFDNFITMALIIFFLGTVFGVFMKVFWLKLKSSRIFYLITPKLIKPFDRDKQ